MLGFVFLAALYIEGLFQKGTMDKSEGANYLHGQYDFAAFLEATERKVNSPGLLAGGISSSLEMNGG